MSGPIVFISHFQVLPGQADAYRAMAAWWVRHIGSEKPQTAGFLHYLDTQQARVTIVHLFGDARAMDAHFEGADDRAREAWKVLSPAGWEIYGPASDQAVTQMREAAEAAGVPLTVQSQYVAGFVRPTT